MTLVDDDQGLPAAGFQPHLGDEVINFLRGRGFAAAAEILMDVLVRQAGLGGVTCSTVGKNFRTKSGRAVALAMMTGSVSSHWAGSLTPGQRACHRR